MDMVNPILLKRTLQKVTMINSLYGRVTGKKDGFLFIKTGGVEWELTVSSFSLDQISPVGEDAKIFVYLHHREDQMKLFGFSTEEERSIFMDLLTVDGIGPKQAIKILSGINPSNFIETLEKDDLENLCRIPGLGRKSAQKILLSLKGKLKVNIEERSEYEDIVNALAEMGFDRKEAFQAVLKVKKELDTVSLDKGEMERELFKKTILLLSR